MAEPIKIPAPDAPAEQWGRLAMRIPGWRWWWEHDKRRPYGLPGYCRHPDSVVWKWVPDVSKCSLIDEIVPDPDDPATAGCLLALLGSGWVVYRRDHDQRWEVSHPDGAHMQDQPTLGRACIAAAAALGRWPGGEG